MATIGDPSLLVVMIPQQLKKDKPNVKCDDLLSGNATRMAESISFSAETSFVYGLAIPKVRILSWNFVVHLCKIWHQFSDHQVQIIFFYDILIDSNVKVKSNKK